MVEMETTTPRIGTSRRRSIRGASVCRHRAGDADAGPAYRDVALALETQGQRIGTLIWRCGR
jgi:hypothetical protein